MIDDSTRQSVLFSDLCGRPVVAQFDQEHASSDGGAILLQACDRRLGLTEALIGAIDDQRQSGKIRHAIGDLVRQRLYAIGCGYPDANDASRLGSDPISKLLCDRDPVKGAELASQPTLSRFELRLRAARTAFRSAQVSTLREHLMKLGAWVESSVRRIVLHLPASCIHRNDWQIIATSLGAAPA